jgi:hypothetical protein
MATCPCAARGANAAATAGFVKRANTLVSARYRVRAIYVPSPLVCRIEVEASVLAEERDEFKSTFGVDNLPECGVDGVSESPRPEDRRRFTRDILIYINGCL